MKKYVFSLLFLLVIAAAFGQKKPLPQAPAPAKKTSLLHLISSSSLEKFTDATGKNTGKVHDGVFQQDNSILRSDSAYYYPDQNMIDAFGHVHIIQGDTLNIYSDKLNYNGNTKLAILTDHVKMIDKDATLTTDYLTYNTGTRIANYNNGGKLVNKDNTLVSKVGYYFSFTHDAYFRYDVVCNTPDAIIKSDTLRYNTGTRISYFYGPTHILGRKDKDTLYTENGDYNTNNEQARFGKKNKYTQGTKTLKGDSLFYDRLKGYGRAVKHVVFNDNEQKTTIYGDLGEYYKADDRAVVTQNAYMVFVTEDKDTTKADTTAKKLTPPSKADSVNKKLTVTKGDPLLKKLGLKADSLEKKQVVKITRPDTAGKKAMLLAKTDSTAKKLAPASVKPKTPTGKAPSLIVKGKPDTSQKAKLDTTKHIKRDSLFMAADTLETQIVTYKDLKTLRRARFLANNRDTSIKIKHYDLLTKLPKFIDQGYLPGLPADTSIYHKLIFGKPKLKPVVIKKKPVKVIDPKKFTADSLRKIVITDSLQVIADHGLKDTSRVRIISGHHHAKIFKSDLQAKADSMFYGYSDSTIRMFVKPVIWTQGSQLSGDTINLQMKNRKLDNIDLFPNSFIVNIEKKDSVHFNQVGGKTMHGTFKDSKLNTMLVTGNAEAILLTRDSVTQKIKDLARTFSYQLFIQFKNGDVSRSKLIQKTDQRALPFDKAKEDDKTLKGFIWVPKERPKSKESIIYTYKAPEKKKSTKGSAVKGTVPVKQPFKKGNAKPGGTISLKSAPTAVLKPARDTAITLKPDTLKKPDTTKRMVAPVLKPKPAN